MPKITDMFIFTHDMKREHLKILQDAIVYKTIEKGSIITGEGGRCTGIPFLLDGTLRLFKISESGREMTLYKISAGEVCIMAAICVMGSLHYDFSFQAQSKSILAIISPNKFKYLIDNSEPFKAYIFQMMATRLITSIDKIETVNFISIDQRIKSFLQQNADKNGNIRITHEQIAIELGSSREVISRNLKKLASSGVIHQKRGHINLIK